MTGPAYRPPTGWPAGAPGQGGQPAVHPTVGTHGLPGSPVTHEPAPNAPAAPMGWQPPGNPAQPQPPYGAPAAPAAPAAPHPTVPFGPSGGQPASQPAPAAPAPAAPAAPIRTDIPDHVILDGAGVPPELRGRSWGQVKQIYGALANDFVLRQNPQAPPAPAAPARPANPPARVQGEPNGGFWEDPGAFIERAIDQRLAPVTQRTTAVAIQEAKQVAASGIPDWQLLEGEVMSLLAGAENPAALTDPRLWQSTADLARGRLMSRGEYDPRAMQRQPAGQPGQPNGQYPAVQAPMVPRGPGAYVPAPVNPVNAFFTEAPTPPMNGQYDAGTGSDVASRVAALTTDQRNYAAKMQMSLEDYVMWQGGVVATAPTRRY